MDDFNKMKPLISGGIVFCIVVVICIIILTTVKTDKTKELYLGVILGGLVLSLGLGGLAYTITLAYMSRQKEKNIY